MRISRLVLVELQDGNDTYRWAAFSYRFGMTKISRPMSHFYGIIFCQIYVSWLRKNQQIKTSTYSLRTFEWHFHLFYYRFYL